MSHRKDQGDLGRSSTGAIWSLSQPPAHYIKGLVDATSMPHSIAAMLASRQITKEEINHWLEPKLRDLMPNPSGLADMDVAAGRLADAVVAKEKIGIFGDYDVDGASAATILHDVLTNLGLEVSIHIPHRFHEGYGPNLPALLGLKEAGCHLILTVDCGITANAPIAATVEAGVEVIIVDHHLPGPDLPPAVAVVNPNRLDDETGLGYMAAAGVVFMLMVALVRELRQRDWFIENNQPEPDLMQGLDCVALATIADVVPLQGLNRAFVRSGLKVMAQRGRPGLKMLADIARLNTAPDSGSLGFVLGPRINAGGRFGESDLGVGLLTTRDPQQALEYATALDQLNTKRQQVERETTEAAMRQAEGRDDLVLCLAGEGWHEGVIGISAGRIKEAFDRPACVISVSTNPDGGLIGKGSGRSIAGFRLGSAIIAAKQKGLLLAGGGHDMAAGFSLDMKNFEAFCAFINRRAELDLASVELTKEWHIDAEIPLTQMTVSTLDWLDRAGPFGSGFPEPIFMVAGVQAKSVRVMGKSEEHMALRLDDGLGQVDAVAFRVAGTPLGQALSQMKDGRTADIIGRMNRNRFRGEDKAQLMISDIRFVA